MAGRHRGSAQAGRPHLRTAVVATGLVVVALGTAAVVALVNRATHRARPGSEPTAAAAASPTTSAPSATTPPAPPPSRRPTPAAATLVLRTSRGASWVEVTGGGGRTLLRGLVPRWRTKAFRSSALRVVVGNAPAVDLVVNGRPRPRAPAGAVLRLLVLPYGVR